MSSPRTCTECGTSLAGRGPKTRTCSDGCRKKRSKRQRDAAYESELAQEGRAQVGAVVRNEVADVAHEVMREELRPIVREMLTEDVMRSVSKLVALTGRAIDAIADDLESEDVTVRARAAALVTKYTIGHGALVTPKDADPNRQLVVNFQMPRPTDIPAGINDVVEAESDEVMTCDECGTEKPVHEFVGSSDRCVACFDKRRNEVLARFGSDA